MALKQDAIAAYVIANVPPDDLGFAGILNTMIQGTEGSNANSNMTPSAKTAFCTSVTQSAKHWGFID
jgi:hypothetical protein